jgi:hypothetical protein
MLANNGMVPKFSTELLRDGLKDTQLETAIEVARAHTRTEDVSCPAWSEDSGSPAPDPNSNASLGIAQERASQSSLDIKLRSECLVPNQEQDKI